MRVSVKGIIFTVILLTTFIVSSYTAWAGMLKMPITFIENRNIIESDAKFYIRTPQASAAFNKSSVDFIRDKKNVRMEFAGASDSIKLSGIEELDGKINIFHGRDSSKWQTGIKTYKKLHYNNVWNGINIEFAGQGSSLKYDVLLDPHSDISNIKVRIADAQKLWIDKSGVLHIEANGMQLTEKIPASYQMIGGRKVETKVSYIIYDSKTYGFSAKNYNPKYSLVIDPASDLKWSSLMGGDSSEKIDGLAVDASGAVYICGWTISYFNFPTTPGAYRQNKGLGDYECFIAKVSPDGNKLMYCTYLGGSSDDAFGSAYEFPGSCIAVDSAGKAYITGYTYSGNFPVTDNAYKKQLTGSKDVFVAKFNENGSVLEYSTLIGGSAEEYSNGIALDPNNNVYIVGGTSSTDYPSTAGVVQPNRNATELGSNDAFVTKFKADFSGLAYSTFLGGNGSETGNCITVDAGGHAFVGGTSIGAGIPTTPNSHMPAWNYNKGFLVKLNINASIVVFGTYVNGEVYSVALGPDNDIYIGAKTDSAYVATTPTAVQKTFGGWYDGVIASYDSWTGALKYSTYLGGTKAEILYSISVDSKGNIYAGGYTTSTDFPTTDNSYSPVYGGGFSDGFFVKIDKDSGLEYSSYIGGADQDYVNLIKAASSGYVYVAGDTTSKTTFPVTPGAFQQALYGGKDGFVAKFRIQSTPNVTITSPWSQPNFYTKENVATVGGTSDVANITYITSNGESGDCTVTPVESGGYTFHTPQFSLKDGRNIITITATDSQSNTDTDVISVYVDNTVPTVTITQPNTQISTTDFGSAYILGTSGDNNAVVGVYCSNNSGNSILCTGISPWQTELTLTKGENVITATAYDEAGNVGTDTVTITYNPPDSENPVINILSPTSSSTYTSSNAKIDLAGSASDNTALAFINWSTTNGDSGQIANPQSSWTISDIPLTVGSNVITVTAVDGYLNSSSDTITVTYNGPGLDITILSPTIDPIYADNTGFISISGTAGQGVTKVTWENSAGGKGNCKGLTNWSASKISLVPGNNVIKVTAINKAKKTGFDTLLVVYTDVTYPQIRITSPSSKVLYTTTKASLILGGVASDNKILKKVTWSNAATGASGDCKGTKSWKSLPIALKLGSNEITAHTEDLGGNTAIDVITVTRQDKVKPKATIKTPTTKSSLNLNAETITLGGISSDDVEVSKVEWLNKSTGAYGVCTGTAAWTSAAIPLQIGKNNIVITVSDTSNNKATDTISITRKK